MDVSQVVDERRVLRLPHAEVLEVQRAREPIEQALTATEDDRRDDDGQLVDEPCSESLTDDVGSSHDMHILAAGGFRGLLDSLFHTGHERESAATRLFLRPVRDDEDRQPPRIFVAPVSRGLVRPTPADNRADPRESVGQPGGVCAGRLAFRLGVVRPRAAEDPVVQSLATFTEPCPGPSSGPAMYPSMEVVIPARTLVIQSHPFRSRHVSSVKTVRAGKTHRAVAKLHALEAGIVVHRQGKQCLVQQVS
jgi:hypothetical protein